MRFRLLVSALFPLFSLSTLPARAQTPFFSDLESDPTPAGWNKGPNDSWTTEQAFSGTHSIKATGPDGFWWTPRLNYTTYDYYQLSFMANAPAGRGFFGSGFQQTAEYKTTPGWQSNQVIFRANTYNPPQPGIFGASSGGPVYIDDVSITPLTHAQAAASLDSFYATLPSYTFTPNPTRHQHLQSSLQKLSAGQPLKVVMLGDSIVADTSGSFFETLVERQYPGSRINVSQRVRGGTGMWYYKEPGRVKEWVLSDEPDLVMIGGISHGNDIDSVESVIDQIRAGRPGTEILLMPDAAAGFNPYTNPELTQPLDPTGPSWRSQMFRLAERKDVEFLDVTEGWADYIAASGLPYDRFLRDSLHMSSTGQAVMGQLLNSYFTPVPEPTTLATLALATLPLLRRRRRAHA